MSHLLETVIEAHGGFERWNQLDAISVHGVNGGALWALKGQPGVLDNVYARASLHQERESHHPFGASDRRSAFGSFFAHRHQQVLSFAEHAINNRVEIDVQSSLLFLLWVELQIGKGQ